jgi:hypothetical protein
MVVWLIANAVAMIGGVWLLGRALYSGLSAASSQARGATMRLKERVGRLTGGPRRLTIALVATLAILYIGWIGYVISRDKPIDFYLYYVAAYGFSHGKDIYGMGNDYAGENYAQWVALAKEAHVPDFAPPYRYPPLVAVLVWPLTLISPRGAALIWLVATAISFVAAAWLLGRSTRTRYGVPLALGLLLFFVPPLTTLHAGQINGLVLLALAFALYASTQGRPIWLGIGTGVAAMLKLVPVAHLTYLGWRGQWKATLTGLLVIVLLFCLATPLIGGTGLISYVRNFFSLGQPNNFFPIGANQSINGFIARLLLTGGGEHLSNSMQLAQWLWRAALLALVVATVALCWPGGDLSRLFELEFALITTVINLLTPYAWYHQAALLLVPFFVLVWRALTQPLLRWMLVPLLVGYLATDMHGLAWHYLEPYPLLVSMPFYTMLMLWGLLAWLIVRERRAGRANAS